MILNKYISLHYGSVLDLHNCYQSHNKFINYLEFCSKRPIVNYLTIIEYRNLMKNIISILVVNLLLISFTYNIYATALSEGVLEDIASFTFITKSDDNLNIPYVPGYGNLSNLEPQDFTTGSAHEVNTTINSLTEPSNASSGQINPIQEYKTNSSDWNIKTDTNPDLNQSFVTNLNN